MWYLLIGLILGTELRVEMTAGPYSTYEDCMVIKDHPMIIAEYSGKHRMCVEVPKWRIK